MVEERIIMDKLRLLFVIGATAVALTGGAGIGAPLPARAASTVSLAVTGSVQCEHGQDVVGIWVASSGGGGGWAGLLQGHDKTVDYFRYPAAHGTFTTAVNSNITLDVGCGGNPQTWASNNKTDSPVTATSNGNLVVNAYNCVASSPLQSGKTVPGTCDLPPLGTPGSKTENPANTTISGSEDCTCGASYMWLENGTQAAPNPSDPTYPGWGGNASQWARNAGGMSRPWKVLTYPAAHALLVNTTAVDSDGQADGHVGWVTGINVLTGTVTYIDMNGLDTCGPDQNGSCSYLFQSRTVPLKTLEASGDFFVLRQPGYEWSWGSGAYPATPRQCTESYTG